MEQVTFGVKEIISLAALFMSLFALGLSLKSFFDTHRHKRLEYTLQLIKDWDKDTLESRAAIMNFHDTYNTLSVIPLSKIEERRKEERQNIVEGKLPLGTPLITDHMAVVLNFMESFAIAIEMGVADEKYLRATYNQTFQRWYAMLKPFCERYNDETLRTHNPWHQLGEMLKRWKPSAENPKEKTSPGEVRKKA